MYLIQRNEVLIMAEAIMVLRRVLKPGHVISLCFALYHRYNLIQMISQSLEVHFYKPTLQENCVLREIT